MTRVVALVTSVDPAMAGRVEALVRDLLRCRTGSTLEDGISFRVVICATYRPPELEHAAFARLGGVASWVFWPHDRVPPYPRGLVEGVERAIAVGFDLLVVMNDDLGVVDREWLRNLVKVHRLHPTAIIGAKLYYPDRKRIQHAGGFFLHTSKGPVGGHYGEVVDVGCPSVNQERYVQFVTGACMAIPRVLFDAIGTFDPDLPAWEDSEFCLRAWSRGYEVLYTPRVVFEHDHRNSSASLEKHQLAREVVGRRYGLY